MNRAEGIQCLKNKDSCWDVVIVGGGATGFGCALDAVSRGFRTLVLEQADFANGTSSRSTKLIHGGVRYLRQGNISLVRESLRERGWLLNHLPGLVTSQSFLIPTYSFWETWYYRLGLWAYDRLAGNLRIESSRKYDRQGALDRVPTLKAEGLFGAVLYWDGQFDDARLCIRAARTIWKHGGLALNYTCVEGLAKSEGRLDGVEVTDKISGDTFTVKGKCFIQATGIFSDVLRQEDSGEMKPMIRASRGSHIVVDRDFLPNDTAVMVPKTSDGRLLFLVPWMGKVIVGTTDVPDGNICLEPKPTEEEVDFILDNAAPYLSKPIQKSDIRSVYSGLRPLVQDPKAGSNTASISRNHVIEISSSGLITIAGGKWTTFRKMGEDAIDKAIESSILDSRPSASTGLPFVGIEESNLESYERFQCYGSEAQLLESWIEKQPELGMPIHESLPYTWSEILFAIRFESVETVEDVLARRTRALLLDAKAAVEAAPAVGKFMAKELGRSEVWVNASLESFVEIAQNYWP